MESGRNFPTLGTLEKIAKVLEVNLPDFFNYDYIEDIEVLKETTSNKIKNMDENQLRQLFKYISTL